MLSPLVNQIRDILLGQQPEITSASYTTTGTKTLIAAPGAGIQIQLIAIWLGCANDHATDTMVVTVQSSDNTPVVYAEVFVKAGTAQNGLVSLRGIPPKLTANKALQIIITGGTPNGVRATAYTHTTN